MGNGYGESKYVSERVRIFAFVNEFLADTLESFQILAQSGLQSTSFRIGQISGGHPNGAWATTDWVPILIKSSLNLNALPVATGVGGFVTSIFLFLSILVIFDLGHVLAAITRCVTNHSRRGMVNRISSCT